MKVRQTTTCHTCRARKLGCDGKLPACTQCLFTGRQCAGYRHDLIFVQHRHLPTGQLLRTAIQDPLENAQDERATNVATPVGGRNSVSIVPHREATVTQATISPFVFATKFPLEECSALIVCKYAPWLKWSSADSNLAIQPLYICFSWVGVLPKLLGEGAPGGAALSSAMSTLGLSIMCKDTILQGPATLACVREYCLALGLLRNGLLNADGFFGSELVAASMCLSLAEFMLPTSKKGWMAHLKGVGEVLQLSGPTSYSAGASFQLFRGLRPLLLFEAFQSRTSSFLALEEWQTIPFLAHPPLALDVLLCHAAIIPSLMERFDTVIESPLEAYPPAAHDTWLSFSQVLGQLHEWEHLYRLDIKGPAYWQRHSQEMNVSLSVLEYSSGESFWFPNVLVANAFTHLWAFRIVCLAHFEQLESRYPDLASRRLSIENQTSAQPIQGDIFELSTWICKSVEYLMQTEMRLFGPVSMLFPFKIAYETLKLDRLRNTEQLDYCQHIIDQLVFKGFNFATLL